MNLGGERENGGRRTETLGLEAQLYIHSVVIVVLCRSVVPIYMVNNPPTCAGTNGDQTSLSPPRPSIRFRVCRTPTSFDRPALGTYSNTCTIRPSRTCTRKLCCIAFSLKLSSRGVRKEQSRYATDFCTCIFSVVLKIARRKFCARADGCIQVNYCKIHEPSNLSCFVEAAN